MMWYMHESKYFSAHWVLGRQLWCVCARAHRADAQAQRLASCIQSAWLMGA